MPQFDTAWLLETLILIPPLLFSLVIHEYAHARTALAFGDHSAYHLGRVSFNPLVHLDPVGTLCIILGGFGWAKPVPVNPLRLSPRKLGSIAVSAAGPLSNLMLAVVVVLLARLWAVVGPRVAPETADMVAHYMLYLASVNIGLCVFNLIPLFPLDGHHVVGELLPVSAQGPFMDWQRRFGAILLLALVFGPRLLSAFLPNVYVPSPLRWFLRTVGGLLARILGM